MKVMSSGLPFVKTARITLSQPHSVKIGLNTGQVVRVSGEAAREPINAIALAKRSPGYRSTFGLPAKGGEVMVVAVDGKNLDATIKG
jgi:hypothetical protein